MKNTKFGYMEKVLDLMHSEEVRNVQAAIFDLTRANIITTGAGLYNHNSHKWYGYTTTSSHLDKAGRSNDFMKYFTNNHKSLYHFNLLYQDCVEEHTKALSFLIAVQDAMTNGTTISGMVNHITTVTE